MGKATITIFNYDKEGVLVRVADYELVASEILPAELSSSKGERAESLNYQNY